jgi:hypothetical protein
MNIANHANLHAFLPNRDFDGKLQLLSGNDYLFHNDSFSLEMCRLSPGKNPAGKRFSLKGQRRQFQLL